MLDLGSKISYFHISDMLNDNKVNLEFNWTAT